jgi:hypothetical protein
MVYHQSFDATVGRFIRDVVDQLPIKLPQVRGHPTSNAPPGPRLQRNPAAMPPPAPQLRHTPAAKAMPGVPKPAAPVGPPAGWFGAAPNAIQVAHAAVVTATGKAGGTAPAGEPDHELRAHIAEMAQQMTQMAQLVQSLVQQRSRSASYESSRGRGYSRASSAGTYGRGRDRSADGRGYGSSARGRSADRRGNGSHGHGRDRSAGSHGYGRSDRGRAADEGKGEGKASNEGKGAGKGAGKASKESKGKGAMRRKGSEGADGRRTTFREQEGGASPPVRQHSGRSPQRAEPRRAVAVWKARAVTHQTGSRTAIVQPIIPDGFEEDSADAPPVRVEVTSDTEACSAFEDVIDECDGHQTASRRKRRGSPGGVWWTVLVPDGMPGFNFDVRGLIRRRILAKEISTHVLSSRYTEAWQLLLDHPAALGVTAAHGQAGAGYGLLHTALVRNTPDWFMSYVFNRTAIPICLQATGVRTGATVLHLACSNSWVRVVQELAGVLSLSPHSLQGSTAAGPTSGGPPFFCWRPPERCVHREILDSSSSPPSGRLSPPRNRCPQWTHLTLGGSHPPETGVHRGHLASSHPALWGVPHPAETGLHRGHRVCPAHRGDTSQQSLQAPSGGQFLGTP